MIVILPPFVLFRIHVHSGTKIWTILCHLVPFKWKSKLIFFRILCVNSDLSSHPVFREPLMLGVTVDVLCFLSKGN